MPDGAVLLTPVNRDRKLTGHRRGRI
jgi:hypothetical protein